MTSSERLSRELRLRRYAYNSITSYCSCLETFIKKVGEKPSIEAIKEYLLTINSVAQHKQMVATIHHYFKLVLKQPLSLRDIPYPAKVEYLPDVLSTEEVRDIFTKCRFLKHKAVLSLLYGCGLRISEVINLRIDDIDSKRWVIKIRDAKGAKDRYVPLHQETLTILRKYYSSFKPKPPYLFNGDGSLQYTQASIGKFLKKYAKKAGVKKKVSAHIFRHSFATHMIEKGVDVSIIQNILGHKSQKTTLIYARISSKIISSTPSLINEII